MFAKLGAAGVAAAVAISLVAPAAQAGQKVKPDFFGIHSFASEPGVESGAMRLNCFPLWREVEAKQGEYDWAKFDFIVDQAESWQGGQLMYSFCGTPQWAGTSVKQPEREAQGKGATSAPTKMSYYKDFATAVVKRYKGRISQYQAWNEPTSPQFFQGTPAQMAKMTKILNKVVQKEDPKAKVLSASVQTHVPVWYKDFALPYFKKLKKKKWPVDVMTGHFYPAGKGGPNQRVKTINSFKADLKRLKMPKRIKMWDTEANFYTDPRVAKTTPDGRVVGKKAAIFLSRNYLDTLRTGLKRSYWYMWTVGDQDLAFPGVQLRSDLPATAAWQTLYGWINKAKYKSSKTDGKLVRMSFKKSGKTFEIAFTTKGKKSLNTKGKDVESVYGKSPKSGKNMKVTKLPVRIG